jgi:hypothetical protein
VYASSHDEHMTCIYSTFPMEHDFVEIPVSLCSLFAFEFCLAFPRLGIPVEKIERQKKKEEKDKKKNRKKYKEKKVKKEPITG